MIFFATGGFCSRKRAQALVHEGLHRAGDVGVQLALGLAFELRLRQLHADDGDQTFAHVVAGQVLLHVLEQAQRLAGRVDGARQRRAEAGEMRSAVDRVDVVGEGEDRLGVGVVVLQRNLHGHVVALGLHVDRLVVQHLLALVQVLDELRDAADVLELLVLALAGLGVGGALVGQVNLEALVQEGELAQPLRQRVVVVLGDGKDASCPAESGPSFRGAWSAPSCAAC